MKRPTICFFMVLLYFTILSCFSLPNEKFYEDEDKYEIDEEQFNEDDKEEASMDELIGNDIVNFPNEKRGAAYSGSKWPKVNGAVRIPFIIEDGHDYKETIEKAIHDFNSHFKCGGLVPRTNEKDYIKYAKGKRCQSPVGHVGNEQKIEIGGYKPGWFTSGSNSNCNKVSIILHETMHAAGFLHEQNRIDRDDFITIHMENVQDRAKTDNFDKNADWYEHLDTAYDFQSIMHYGRKYFSKNGKNTLDTINYNGPVGNNKLSPIDIDELNKYFGCEGNIPALDKTGINQCTKQKTDCYKDYYWKCLIAYTCPCKGRYKYCCKTAYKCESKSGHAKIVCEKSGMLCLVEI